MNSLFRPSVLTAALTLVVTVAFVAGAEESSTSGEVLRVHRSSHFVLYTDLPLAAAQDKLNRLEATLKQAERYWRRPLRGQIECYVIADLDACPDSALPHPLARVWVAGVEGATITGQVSGHRAPRARATLYASAREGVAEHEVVHAYCCQTFGHTGPDWYKEGMAQVLAVSPNSDAKPGCSLELFQRSGGRAKKTSREIVQAGRFTGELSGMFGSMLAGRRDESQHVPLTAFTHEHAEKVDRARPEYLSSWLLCHMLYHNPNYSERFRLLGECYLTGSDGSFGQIFAAQQDEIAFEYEFYVKHIAAGYRVDLCYWDWNAKFHSLAQRPRITRDIQAARGYQASGLTVTAGQKIEYAIAGSWRTGTNKRETTAGGGLHPVGRVVGVVMDGLQLTDPFELGDEGTLTAPAGGNLYLRCNDSWCQLADNHGSVRVQFQHPQHER
jgi:hypothetical protein